MENYQVIIVGTNVDSVCNTVDIAIDTRVYASVAVHEVPTIKAQIENQFCCLLFRSQLAAVGSHWL